MSLRRSARVQALGPATKAINENSLKRAFATTKSGKTKQPSKDLGKSTTAHALTDNDSAKENGSAPKPSPKLEAQRKRRKVQPKETSEITAPDASALPNGSSSTHAKVQSTIVERPVESHATNAPLSSPQDGKVAVAYSHFEDAPTVTTSTAPPPPTSTTSTVLEQAISHLLKNDHTGRLAPMIAKHNCNTFSPAGLSEVVDPFSSLSSGIMGQQVSGAAATSIKNKFLSLFPADTLHNHPGPPAFPPPSLVAGTPLPTLRTAGLSQRKAEYIQGMAEKFVSGELSTEMLLTASDDEVMTKLVAVRGLGKWSVEMFALFGLKRLDVFSTGDLGVQRGMAVYVGKDVGKLKAKGGGKWKYMSEKDMLDFSAPFAPYRSLFTWYMWRLSDVNLDALEKA